MKAVHLILTAETLPFGPLSFVKAMIANRAPSCKANLNARVEEAGGKVF
jgi:hypothetical protein